MMSLFGGGGEDSEESKTDEEENKPPEVAQELRDGWERRLGVWVSEYEAEIHIPFTRATVEFGFLNGGSKTIEFDDLPNQETEKTTETGGVTREEYYKFCGEVSFDDGSFGTRSRLPQNRLTPDIKEQPELTTTSANVNYKEIRETEELVIVMEVTARDFLGDEQERVYWEVSEFNSVSVIPRHELDSEIQREPRNTIRNEV